MRGIPSAPGLSMKRTATHELAPEVVAMNRKCPCRGTAERRFVVSVAGTNCRPDAAVLLKRLGLSGNDPDLCCEAYFREEHLDHLAATVCEARSREVTFRLQPEHFRSYLLLGSRADVAERVRASLKASGLKWYLEESSLPSGECGLDAYNLAQGHLDPSPIGIGARTVWDIPGGDGSGVRLADVEMGWYLDHPDLREAPIEVRWGFNNDHGRARSHGTAVLGILAARRDGKGTDGIAYGVSDVGLYAIQEERGKNAELAAALVEAIRSLVAGDVLLIEQHTQSGAKSFRPVEVEAAISDLVYLATTIGIVVIEPAGNGCHDLGDRRVLDPDKGETSSLDVLDERYRDSGAILVGGLDPLPPRGQPMKRDAISNWGDRVNCCAWARNIATTGYYYRMLVRLGLGGFVRWGLTKGLPPSLYGLDGTYCHFSGTSGAAALVAGAVLSIQGMAQMHLGSRLRPLQIRSLLENPENGTRPADGAMVGGMPNLEQIAKVILANGRRFQTPATGIKGEMEVAIKRC